NKPPAGLKAAMEKPRQLRPKIIRPPPPTNVRIGPLQRPGTLRIQPFFPGCLPDTGVCTRLSLCALPLSRGPLPGCGLASAFGLPSPDGPLVPGTDAPSLIESTVSRIFWASPVKSMESTASCTTSWNHSPRLSAGPDLYVSLSLADCSFF